MCWLEGSLDNKTTGFKVTALTLIDRNEEFRRNVNHRLLHTWTWLLAIFHFEVAQLGPKFEDSITTLELKVLNHINNYFKNLGQDLSFEGSNIFVGILKVGFLAL